MISVVVPMLNEKENLPVLVERVTQAASTWNDDWEVILVDDGSSDGSQNQMAELASENPHFRVVRLSRTFGHQAAISAGIQHARGDAVAIMDGDLQDPPEVLELLLEKWRAGYQVVYGVRTKRKEGALKRLLYSSFYRILNMVSEFPIPLDSGDFCVMDRRVVDTINNGMPEGIRFVRGLRAYAGFKHIGVRYERAERWGGEVKYSFRKLMKLALDGIFGFSLIPLRLSIYVGLIVSVISFLLGTYFLLHRVFQFPVFGYLATDTPGLASLAVGVFFLGGVIMVLIGILGEYIGRIYIEVKKRPTFIVDDVFPKSFKSTDDSK